MGERKCVGVFCRELQATIHRFLPTQEWSTGGRGFVGVFWGQCGRQFGELAATTMPKYAHTLSFPHRPFLRRQESIPAEAGIPQTFAAAGGVSAAGMSCGRTKVCRHILAR